jgi:hypothetical protein
LNTEGNEDKTTGEMLSGFPIDLAAQGVAHIRVLEDFLVARSSAAVGQKLLGTDGGSACAIDEC